jgi:hypothetical protein
MIASAPPNETPPPGLIRPASVSSVEGSEEGLSAGFTDTSPLTGDAKKQRHLDKYKTISSTFWPRPRPAGNGAKL